MWFQEDSATCHTARVTMDLLRGEFGEHFILRSGPVNQPPRSCGLTPLDYFLWGYVQALVYTDKPASIDALEGNIEAFIRDIPAEMSERVCQNWTKRMDQADVGAVEANIFMKYSSTTKLYEPYYRFKYRFHALF